MAAKNQEALVERTKLKGVFQALAKKAKRIDVAVAWVRDCDELDLLLDRARSTTCRVRFVVGLDGNVTQPEALDDIVAVADIRVCVSQRGYFHPKFYRFADVDRGTCLVGSANLTRGGFEQNDELMVRFDDGAGEGREWFEKLWSSLPEDPTAEIERYRSRYRPLEFIPKASSLLDPNPPSDVTLLLRHNMTWREYVAALQAADTYWVQTRKMRFSVFGETASWMHTLTTAHAIGRKKDWGSLSEREREILMPARREEEGVWGLLGSMGSARKARPDFLHRASVRTKIRRYLQPAMASSSEDEFLDAARAAIANICRMEGFGPGVATRLLAIVRPDRALSVNRGSAAKLSQAIGDLPATANLLGGAARYPDLLRWVYRQPWYKDPAPADPFELAIWRRRAALIDCFVYEVPD